MVTSRGVMVTRYLGVILTSEVPFSNKVLFVACFYIAHLLELLVPQVIGYEMNGVQQFEFSNLNVNKI